MTFTLHPRDPSLHDFLTGRDLAKREHETAMTLREDAAARYDDAVRRRDTRDQAAYALQLMKATNRLLEAERGLA